MAIKKPSKLKQVISAVKKKVSKPEVAEPNKAEATAPVEETQPVVTAPEPTLEAVPEAQVDLDIIEINGRKWRQIHEPDGSTRLVLP